MSKLYKIESYSETCVKQIANLINKSGGQCVICGWAIITDHIFDEKQTQNTLGLVSRITDMLSDADIHSWSLVSKQAA